VVELGVSFWGKQTAARGSPLKVRLGDHFQSLIVGVEGWGRTFLGRKRLGAVVLKGRTEAGGGFRRIGSSSQLAL